MPLNSQLSVAADYCTVVSRANLRPHVDVFEWTLRDRLPPIPVPLSNGDPDATVDLQNSATAVYDRSGYVHYDEILTLPLRPNDASWVRAVATRARQQRCRRRQVNSGESRANLSIMACRDC